MEHSSDMKALFIVINAGFADEIVKITREAGAGGATILHARGGGTSYKSIMGITIDSEKELVLSLVNSETANRIMSAVKDRAGLKSAANGICFTMPIDNITGINPIILPLD